ncbi:hypothetical protein CISIN_1g033632mg [Citrus sinensis]|uniref:Uncharacterized protein n=2 Tax=Citrus sinensis TaxID=2711 RepID=A0A067DRP1_CITSI|nr:hypothetical protein CISIN_1g033632mg [Citrus sinensis]
MNSMRFLLNLHYRSAFMKSLPSLLWRAFKSLMSCSVAVPGFYFNKFPMVAGVVMARPRRVVVVRAKAQGINLDIRKMEEKVVDSVVVKDLSKPLTAYCRFICWFGLECCWVCGWN